MIDALPEGLMRLIGNAEAARVTTTTLLPSGALALISVRSTKHGSYVVSDEGAAREDLMVLGLGKLSGADTRRANAVAERFGLIFDGATFSVRDVTPDQIQAAVVFVAEAAREWAKETSEHVLRRTENNLVRRIEERLTHLFPTVSIDRERELAGASTKRHRFDLVMNFTPDRLAVIEVISPNANSLSSAHLKFYDMMVARPDWPRESITERLDAWSAADINLLAGVSTHVRDMKQDWQDLSNSIH